MKFGRRKGLVSGGGMGIVMFIIFVIYCVIFWYGCKLVREDDDYTAGTMLIVSIRIIHWLWTVKRNEAFYWLSTVKSNGAFHWLSIAASNRAFQWLSIAVSIKIHHWASIEFGSTLYINSCDRIAI